MCYFNYSSYKLMRTCNTGYARSHAASILVGTGVLVGVGDNRCTIVSVLLGDDNGDI